MYFLHFHSTLEVLVKDPSTLYKVFCKYRKPLAVLEKEDYLFSVLNGVSIFFSCLI